MSYNINQVATITGLTTRTLRNYLKQGILQGEKIDGAWTFTPEALEGFLSDPSVKQMITAKQHTVVYDFMADTFKKSNRICTIADFPVSSDEAREISEYFCQTIQQTGHDIEFRFMYERNIARIILSGSEDQVMDLLNQYYQKEA